MKYLMTRTISQLKMYEIKVFIHVNINLYL